MAVLKPLKELCCEKQYSHQAVDTIREIYILNQCLMMVITSTVSAILQVCQLISFQVKQGQFTVLSQNDRGPPDCQEHSVISSVSKREWNPLGKWQAQGLFSFHCEDYRVCLGVDLNWLLFSKYWNYSRNTDVVDNWEGKK